MDGIPNQPNPSAAMFGLRRGQKQVTEPLGLDDSTTAWEVYNTRALMIDRELVKDWNDSLNTLLIFAALYSAVLTAFITESMKLLQEDPMATTRDAILSISRQLANNSLTPFEPSPFVPPDYAVRVNCYFFLSISSSLVAALGAVLALQWVGSYDAGLNQSSPEHRALQRHFRYLGVEKWKMVQIIAFLPALIFLALFLFFVGLAEWMWVTHHGVAGVVIAGLICGASFSLTNTIIGMFYIEAPFRTPASRSLPQFFSGIHRFFLKSISKLSQGVQESAPSMQKPSPGVVAPAAQIWRAIRVLLGSDRPQESH